MVVPKEQVQFISVESLDDLLAENQALKEDCGNKFEQLQEKIDSLQFELECRPDPENCPDDQIEDDLFFVMETLIVRLGYPRFEQVHDYIMRKVFRIYG